MTIQHKSDFPQKNGKYLLSSFEEIVLWINLGFKKQQDDIAAGLPQKIDLTNCDISINDEGAVKDLRPFYFNQLAGIVDGIIKAEGKTIEVLYNIDFSNSILNGEFLSNIKFKGNVSFMGTTFEGNSVSLHLCVFENWCRFNNASFPMTVRIEQCQFNSLLDFENAQFSNIVNICNSKFGGEVVFQDILFQTKNNEKYFFVYKCDFGGKVSLNNNIFDQALSIEESIFNGQIEFKETTINNSLDINQCQINSVMLFSSKSNTYDIKNIRFYHCAINGEIYFEGANIDDCEVKFSTFSQNGRARFNSCCVIKELRLIESTINGRIDITYSKISKLDMEGTIVPGFINLYETEIKDIGGRYSARILKDSLYRLNNVIDALLYKSREMQLYKDELKKDLANLKSKKICDYILLLLNTASNNNGLSWGRGVVFTFSFAFAFFSLINYHGIDQTYFFEWGWKGWDNFGEVWKNYLNMFYLTDFKDKFDGIKLNAFGETLFFVSKIFIGYGVYQTISAFRKYGK